MKDICKDLQKELRASERIQKRHAIEKILREFKGLQRLSDIRKDGKKMRLTSVSDDQGTDQYGRQAIVDVFAKFYEELYRKRQIEHSGGEASIQAPTTRYANIKPISKSEVKKQASQMKNDKAADGTGIVAEMIKFGGDWMNIVIK